MKTTEKKPSAFATGCEVLRFCADKQYSIPISHHFNLVDFKGCSPYQFEKYLKWGHRLDEQAILHMIETENMAALNIWFKQSSFQITYEVKSAFIQKFGYEALLKKGVELEGNLMKSFLSEKRIDLAIKYFNQLSLGNKDGAFILLRLHNVDLTVLFLKQQCYIHEDICPLILTYDEPVVYKTLFKYCTFLRGISRGLIEKRSLPLFKLMIKKQHEPLPDEDLKLLIDRNELDMLNAYIERRGFNPEIILYIIKHASDEFFATCIRQDVFSVDKEVAYERLFKPENRGLLIDYLNLHPLCSDKWEIRLLQSGDSELIETYRKMGAYSPEAMSYLLVNKLGDKFNVALNDVEPLNWRAEARIFSSGDEKLMTAYLFAGPGKQSGVTAFGEAILFKHASLETLLSYMEEITPDVLAQRVIISRFEPSLYNLFMLEYGLKIAHEVAPAFLAKADAKLAMLYLKGIEDIEFFFNEVSPESTRVLCQRNEPEFYRFVFNNAKLNEEEMILFIRNAPKELVLELIKTKKLSPRVEAEILCHPDKELVLAYLKKRGVYDENEVQLISLLDIQLIEAVEDDFLNSDAAIDLLYP